jgi:hypothetical protein
MGTTILLIPLSRNLREAIKNNMAQEYIITSFKPSDFKDNYGNSWCEVAFEGMSEPARWVVKDPSRIKVGDVVYGHIEDATSRAGKPYNRFKIDQREDNQSSPQKASTGYSESPEKQDSIYRSVALNNAAVVYGGVSKLLIGEILQTADKFYLWLKNESEDPVITEVPDEPINLDDIPF